MRKRLSIMQGDKLAAYASNDIIMLKPIRIPTEQEFESLLYEAHERAASAGYQVTDANEISSNQSARQRILNDDERRMEYMTLLEQYEAYEQKGSTEKAIEIAKKLLAKGDRPQEVAEITGLEKDNINKLKKEMEDEKKFQQADR